MLRFSEILKFPISYSERNNKVDSTNWKVDYVTKNDKKIIFKGSNGSHTVIIEFISFNEGKDINLTTPVKVFCDCESFKFEFAYACDKKEGLLNQSMFFPKPPKEKNSFLIATGCKHIIGFAQFINKNKFNYIKQAVKAE